MEQASRTAVRALRNVVRNPLRAALVVGTVVGIPHVTAVGRGFQVFSVETNLEPALLTLPDGAESQAARQVFQGTDDNGATFIPTTGTDAAANRPSPPSSRSIPRANSF